MARLKLFPIFILLGFFGVAQNSLATPLVSSVSGSVTHGQNIIVGGSEFGTSMGGNILSWDDFESQPVGQTVANLNPVIGHTWTLQQNPTANDLIQFSSTKAHSGTKSVFISWDNNTINAFGWVNKGPYTKLYISYWRWMTGNYASGNCNGQGNCNHKQFYVFGSSASDLPQAVNFIPASDDQWGFMNNQSCNGGTYALENNLFSLTYDQTKETWNRWEFWLKINIVNTADGIIQEWVDGSLKINRTNYKHRCDGVTGEWDDFRLGHMAQGMLGIARAYFDDVYVATTPARVEICSGSTWNNRSHCEIQIPSAWSDNSVTITANAGSFNDGDTTYLYVINADGDMNINGYPVIIGGVSDTTPPAAPTGVVVN